MEPSAEVVTRLEKDIKEYEETKSKELLELIIQGLSDLCDHVVLDSVDSRLLNWYGTSLQIRFDDQKDPTDLDKAIELFQEAARHPTSDTASRAKAINNLGHALQCRWEARANEDDLDAAISNLRTAVRETDMLSPTRTVYLVDFVDALWARIDERGSVSDLNEALEYIGLAELQTCIPEEVYATRLARLSGFLAHSFQRTRSSTDLNRAIGLKKELVGLESCLASEDWYSDANSLSVDLLDRYGLSHASEDLEDATEWAKKAMSRISAEHEDYCIVAYQLAVCFQMKWQRTENVADLDNEIHWYRESIQNCLPNNSHTRQTLNLLGAALCIRVELNDSVPDMEEAIGHILQAKDHCDQGDWGHLQSLTNLSCLYQTAGEKGFSLKEGDPVALAVKTAELAMELCPTDSPHLETCLYNLAQIQILAYEKGGLQQNLESAIGRANECVSATSPDSPNLPRNLAGLSNILQKSFKHNGSPSLIKEAVEAAERAVAHRKRDPNCLSTLGNALVTRAEWGLSPVNFSKDLNDGIAHLDEAIRLKEERFARIPQGFYSNLGLALQTRSELLGSEDDLDKAIVMLEKALESKVLDTTSMSLRHSNLARAFFAKYARRKDCEDLNQAVKHGQLAVDSSPEDDPNISLRRNNLGLSLKERFEVDLDPEDFTRAKDQITKASESVGETDPALPGYLSNLAIAFQNNFLIGGQAEMLDDAIDGQAKMLDDAIEYFARAVTLSSNGNPLAGSILTNLCSALHMRARWKTKRLDDNKKAIDYGEKAFHLASAPPSVRIRAAGYAGIIRASSDHTEQGRDRAATLLAGAVELLPLISPRTLARLDQQHQLRRFNAHGISADAAALALDASYPPRRAMELLEIGRGVMLANILDCRSDTSDLCDAYPELAEELERLRRLVDRIDDSLGTTTPAEDVKPGELSTKLDFCRLQLHRAEEGLKQKVSEIRSKEGFSDFLRPCPQGQLSKLSQTGYIVTINVSQVRCDMLVVKNGDVTAVHLPDLTLATLENKEKEFRVALGNRERDPDSAKNQLLGILEWLWHVCGKPLVDQLGFTRSTGVEKPRVWWIPGGLLGRLPLHACGVYPPVGDQRNEQSMFDYVVSSYAPTLRSLDYSTQRAAQVEQTEQSQVGALIVAVPEGEGSEVLHATVLEANEVRTNFNRSKLLINPSFQEVVGALPNSKMVHFACHGRTNFKDPGNSYLELKDYKDNPLTVETLMKLKLSHCRLAYLSACDTANIAVGDLVDESLHLVSGFMLAGYPRVIGTLWKIPDDLAKEIAVRFYSHLPHRHGGLDTRNSAMALHCAIDELRKTSAGMRDPLAWTAFIHAGA
jgi:hypothetical protein